MRSIKKFDYYPLKKNIHLINKNKFKYFSKKEIFELIQTLLPILYNFIIQNPLIFMLDKYDDLINKYLLNILSMQIMSIININNKENITKELETIIYLTKNLFNCYILPTRSYSTTFNKIKPNYDKLEEKLEYLKNIYQPEQRTDEWYKFRHNTLTASNIWKIFKTEHSRNQLIFEKCEPIKEFNKPNINSPLHWGQKYEPVSILYYEKYYNTIISDFGCIQHNKYSFIAASPDGINTSKDSNLYGRMLEIKNVVSREITGIPKFEYWIQMQLQMEVCQLNECDFLETKFTEYLNEEEFNNDGTFKLSLDNKYKGIILVFEKEENNLYYEYMPLDLSYDQFLIWKKNIIEKNNELTFIKDIFWKLEKISCVLVLRNKFWFNQALPIIENFWNIITTEKITGYQHRAPKKRNQIKNPICLIDRNLFII